MANAFDAANAPEGEPKEVVVGDFIQWKRSDLVSDYPTSSYTAKYVLRTAGGASDIEIVMTGQTTHYLATVLNAASSGYTKGSYYWQLEMERNSDNERVVLERGSIEIVPDLDLANADPRSHAEIMLAKIESLLQGKADSDVASYSIQGRSLTKMSFQELREARDHYRAEARIEKLKRGLTNGTTVKVSF